MEHTEKSPISPYLLAERDRLLQSIEWIRASGTVAPAYCWLVKTSETKGTRTYHYIKLITEKPGEKSTSKSLGKPDSSEHRLWQAAIVRREQITELEQQLKLLAALIDRQQAAEVPSIKPFS